MSMQEAMRKFVEAEIAYDTAKNELQICLAENMPNPFMKVDYAAVRREINPHDNPRGYRK